VAATTTLRDDTITDLLARYDVGAVETHWPASGGAENSNYFVRVRARGDASRDLVLTILEQPPAAGPLLVPLLDTCDRAGLPVAPVIRTRTGDAFESLDGKPALLAPRLLGRHVVNPTLRQCEVVGRFLARFHGATYALAAQAPPHPRDRAWLHDRFDAVHSRMSYAESSLLEDALTAVSSGLGRHDVAQLPRGIVHGDLFRDNVLFTERGLTGVLDFHHASTGFLLYDLAVVANDWCTDGSGLLVRDRAYALLRAYHRIRPLTASELWFFSFFALYAALAFWLSRLVAAIRYARRAGRVGKNPEEFQAIVRQHLAHFLYLDPRELD